ncbi:MAG: CHASE2 domain-containing protein [Vulcanimicrobiaceae bacterium]
MSRRFRQFLLSGSVAVSISVVAILLYSLPSVAQRLPFLQRLGDYAIHLNILANPGVFGFANAPSYDEPNPNIALIDIDDSSIGNTAAGLTPWPFPREVYGKLLARLAQANVKVVAFDVNFLEDNTGDARFAKGLRKVNAALAFQITTSSTGTLGILPVIPILAHAAKAVGYSTVDAPGGFVIGQPPAIIAVDSHGQAKRYNSISVAATQLFLGHTIAMRDLPTIDGRFVLLPPHVEARQALTERAGSQKLSTDFAGGGRLSFADAMTIPIDQLRIFAKDRLVFVGSTAQTLEDKVTTPIGIIGGVYVNLRFVDQFLTHTYVHPASPVLDIILMVLLPLIAAAIVVTVRPLIAVFATLGLLLAFVEINAALFVYKLIWLDLLHTAGATAIASAALIAVRGVREGAERRQVTNLFGMHVSPAVVQEILKSEDPESSLALTGKRVKATVFYSDIRGFTAMSETMSPEAIYGQLNEYFEEMCQLIFEHGGYVDKFIGDCIMAVFSAPYQTPDDALKAVRSAVAQQSRIDDLVERWKETDKKIFTVGMGINTGELVMGNLGSSSRMNYTVIGDTVNTAARLYNVAKGGQIIISQSTYDEVKDFVEVEELEPVSVKGKVEPIRIYQVLAMKDESSQT